MNVIIKTLNGDVYPIEISRDGNCGQLKSKIENILGFPPNEQKLFYERGFIDKNDEKLINFGVKDGCTIHISFYPKEFEVCIHQFNVVLAKIKTKSDETVKNLKSKIENLCSISFGEQILVYKGQILEDNKSLFDSGITEKCFINLIPKVQEETSNRNKVFENILNLFQSNYEPFKPLIPRREQSIIKKRPPKPPLKPLFFVHQKDAKETLGDNQKLNEKQIEIICKTMDGKLSTISIRPSDLIKEMKEKIFEKTEIESSEQRLVYCGILLDEDKQVSNYAFQNQSVVCVVRKLRCKFTIILQLMDGSRISLAVTGNEKIILFKEMIQQKIQIPPERLKLVFSGVVLDNNSSLQHYNICDNSIINCVIKR